jgi:hypothetical protein
VNLTGQFTVMFEQAIGPARLTSSQVDVLSS